MKKLLSSFVSAALSMSCLIGSCEIYTAAYTLNTETGIFHSEEEITLDSASEIDLSLDKPNILSNHSENAYNYYDFLDTNNKAVYDALSDWITPTLDTATVELPETISVALSALPGSSSYTDEDAQAFSNAVFANCKSGIDSLLFDTPEIFWLDEGSVAIGIGSSTYKYDRINKTYTLSITSLKFVPALNPGFTDLDNALEYKAKLEAAIEDFSVQGENRYEQLKYIHDKIAIFTYYDTEAVFHSTAIGSLIEPGVVCEGYSEGFKLICDSLDIPCVSVFGNYDTSTDVAHMWNYVEMEDDKWYAVDLTWDDTDNENEVKYQYFLKGSTSFFTNHTEESDYVGTIFNYPEISESNYEPEQQVTTSTSTATTTTTTTTTTATTSSQTTTTTTSTTSSSTTTTTTTASATASQTTKSTSTATVTTTTTQTTTEVPVFERGDFNHDGEVNVADLVLCAKAVLKGKTEYLCDYDGDGLVNSFDIVFMRKRILI